MPKWKKNFKTTERSSYHVPLSAEEYKLWVHGLVQWHSDCYCHWYMGNFNRHLLITYRPLMVSVHLQNLFSWTRNVCLQYAWEVKCHGKTCSQKFCKNIPCEQCHAKEQYTEKWKMFKFQILCCMKIKHKNLCFSWQRHVYINWENKQPK